MSAVRNYAVPGALVAIPLLLAVVGPLAASPDTTKDVAFLLGGGHWFGTDFVGRDVWNEVLLGGRSLVLTAVTATACTYALAVPLGLIAGMTGSRALDEAIMRPLDLLLAVPSMLMLLLLASVAPGVPWVLIGVVTLINLPDVVRISRAAALSLSSRPAVEAMRLQGESRIRIGAHYVARAMRRTLAADLGTRFTGAIYLVASASFLGVGVSPQTSDWAAMVDRNRAGLFIQPWAVVLPALLVVALSIGVNLAFDRWLRDHDLRSTFLETR
ncbi:peptide/nickel transport system permease protein [Saccharopolyspora antimicrobica]|uniref:Peptide/nickel transport system permease protein n=1 Tax=Saccharopolyspora antimicrobica TaxID=455193 RepID=A0A1I4U8F2_9PSEU|nr:ABC transporter permease [Saccharopolyspora antimicrobica]RKT88734.1 peptide/nickel transport system permease protein [Saccharopolyspora antimicrobica]SFM85252.1 peptide/nickel transport system permease protein [Saccharopolyspora antimicrobica]